MSPLGKITVLCFFLRYVFLLSKNSVIFQVFHHMWPLSFDGLQSFLQLIEYTIVHVTCMYSTIYSLHSITCQCGSAKYSVINYFAFLYKNIPFWSIRGTKALDQWTWNFANVIMSVRSPNVPETARIGWLGTAPLICEMNADVTFTQCGSARQYCKGRSSFIWKSRTSTFCRNPAPSNMSTEIGTIYYVGELNKVQTSANRLNMIVLTHTCNITSLQLFRSHAGRTQHRTNMHDDSNDTVWRKNVPCRGFVDVRKHFWGFKIPNPPNFPHKAHSSKKRKRWIIFKQKDLDKTCQQTIYTDMRVAESNGDVISGLPRPSSDRTHLCSSCRLS